MSAIDDVLVRARQGWDRIDAGQAFDDSRTGALLLVDTRTGPQRREGGELPGALVVDLTVLEWRVDPTADTCIPEARNRPRIALICRQGYSSSLAARRLRDLGLDATDVVGGVEAWRAAGLPIGHGPADIRR